MTTEENIVAEFMRLVEKKPYGEITITEICRASGVSTKTLYKHFENKEGIVRAVVRADCVTPVLAIRELLPVDDIKSSTRLMIEKNQSDLWEHRAFYTGLLKHFGREHLAAIVVDEVSRLNRSIFATYDLSDIECDFAAHYLASAQMSILCWWFEHHEELSPKEVARLFNVWGFSHFRELENGKYDR